MAGKPGMKGGGGKRPGAGRKKLPPVILNVPASIADCLTQKDPAVFLTAVMNDPGSDAKLRVDAAKALLPFVHAKKGEGGKKDAAGDRAKAAAGGKFAPAAPPKLVVSNK